MTPQVSIITESQADELRGLQWAPDCYYGPVETADGWAISEVEVAESDIEWVRKLPLIDFRPKPIKIP